MRTKINQSGSPAEKNSDLFKDFFNLPFTGNAIIGADERWIYFNDHLCMLLQHSREQLLNVKWTNLIHPDDRKSDFEIFEHLLNGELRQYSVETRIIRGDGIMITAIMSFSIISPASFSEEVLLALHVTDITGRKQSEEKSRSNELKARRNLEELEWIYSNAPIGLCHFDLNLHYKRINKFLASINGIPPNAHVGKHIRDVIPSIADAAEEVRNEILSKRRPIHREFIRDQPVLGQPRYFDENWYPLFDESGELTGLGAVVEEITEKKHVLALRAADRRKDELLATLAHELRNPIGSVSAALELMRLMDEIDTSSAGRDRAPLERAERQIAHMKQLVEDILTVERIKQGKIILRKEWYDVVTVIRQAIETVQPKLFEKKISMLFTTPTEKIFLNFDPLRLAQVFTNLLDNSAKFTGTEGRIEISISYEVEEIVIIFRDNGIGIASKNLPSIFEIFNQIIVSHERKTEGVGIGLAIARNLIELHGGSIDARSDGLGKGTAFIVRLPYKGEDYRHQLADSV